MSTENAAWTWLRKGAENNRSIHLQRVENGLARGVPDVEGCIHGVSFWLELKAGPCPVRVDSKIDCEPLKSSQRRFIKKRLAAGGNAWILYRVGQEVYLIHGEDADLMAPCPRLCTLRKFTYVKKEASPREVLHQIHQGQKGY